MTFYVLFFLLLLICLYCGQVLGLMIHCDNCCDFNAVRRYVFFIPLMKFVLIFPCIQDCMREKSLKSLRFYLFSGKISMVILCVMVELLPEWKKQKEQNRIRRAVRQYEASQTSFAATLRSVLLQTVATLEYDL